jgi:putative cell wall-binding protein
VGLGILLVLVLILAAFVAYFFFDVGADSDTSPVAPVDTGATTPTDPLTGGRVGGATVSSLGYPVIATRNTTRINGSDPVDISLAAALAAYPTTGPGTPPAAVTVVGADDWQSGIVAASFSASPIGSPILLAPSGTLSEDALSVIGQLDPTGSPTTDSTEVFTFGNVAPPGGFEVRAVRGPDPASLAVRAAGLKAKLDGNPPDAFVVVSSEDPDFATPAAAWAARSGDPVLFTGRDEAPEATIEFLKQKENSDVPVFVLGPPEAVSAGAYKQLDKVAGSIERVSGSDPAENSVELVRFSSGAFGWNLNDPGHGYTVARADRPMDAIAATALSTVGTWPALLLTDSSDELPEAVLNYLLDVKPGFVTDPTRAVVNHVWIIGDESIIDVDQQAVIDDAVELTPVETTNSVP